MGLVLVSHGWAILRIDLGITILKIGWDLGKMSMGEDVAGVYDFVNRLESDGGLPLVSMISKIDCSDY